jgi:Tol biopolymer transport system component
MDIICSSCGEPNSETGRFCIKCGTQLVSSEFLPTAPAVPNRRHFPIAWACAAGLLMILCILCLGGLWFFRSQLGLEKYIPWLPFTKDKALIVYVTDRDGNQEIYVMKTDGSDPINLTQEEGEDWEPVWSPNGQKILFQSDRDGNTEVYVMNVDGNHLINLSNDKGDDLFPAWSPDGRYVTFTSNREGNNDIFRVEADGTELINLTNDPADDMSAVWSPDGDYIAFISFRDERTSLYRMKIDGKDPLWLTEKDTIAFWPSWSPDGRRIAFQGVTYDENNTQLSEIYVLDTRCFERADTCPGDITQLTQTGLMNWVFDWSADGEQIVYLSAKDQIFDVYVIDVDGKNRVQLDTIDWNYWDVDWSPDGKKFVCASDQDDQNDLYMQDVNGTNVVRLTNDEAIERYPKWSP